MLCVRLLTLFSQKHSWQCTEAQSCEMVDKSTTLHTCVSHGNLCGYGSKASDNKLCI